MNALPLGLMLLSALFHATWNLLLKRSDNQEAFVLGIVVSGSVMFVPLGIVLFWLYPIDPPGYLFALVSTGFQSFYFVMLSRAYSRGDLSLIYPVARGIGPMLVPFWQCLARRKGGVAGRVGHRPYRWRHLRRFLVGPIPADHCEAVHAVARNGASASPCLRGWRSPVTRWWTSAAWSTFNLSSTCTCRLLGAL